MIPSAFLALRDLFSPEFRSILWTAIGLTVALFAALFAIVQGVFWFFTFMSWPWLETVLAIGTGLGMLVLFFFLMAPVTSLFAGFFLDQVASLVENRHYAADKPGKPLSTATALVTSLQFAGLVLVVNVLALPLIFTGIGIFALFIINAYLLSREFFEMAAMRYLPPADAKALRRDNAVHVFVAGFLPAGLALIPFVSLIVPLFSTSYFVHILKRVMKS